MLNLVSSGDDKILMSMAHPQGVEVNPTTGGLFEVKYRHIQLAAFPLLLVLRRQQHEDGDSSTLKN